MEFVGQTIRLIFHSNAAVLILPMKVVKLEFKPMDDFTIRGESQISKEC
jgi:hypothetical protein